MATCSLSGTQVPEYKAESWVIHEMICNFQCASKLQRLHITILQIMLEKESWPPISKISNGFRLQQALPKSQYWLWNLLSCMWLEWLLCRKVAIAQLLLPVSTGCLFSLGSPRKLADLGWSMCAAKNNVDEIGDFLQEKEERDNLMDCQDMKDLDDLLETIEDHDFYCLELFETIMYVQVTSLSCSSVSSKNGIRDACSTTDIFMQFYPLSSILIYFHPKLATIE